MTNSDINAIRARQHEVRQEIARLQEEVDELDTTLRVLQRFSSADDYAATKLGPPRPEGVPTLFEMVNEILSESANGLTGRQIVAAIGERYWPGVKGQQIMPSVYGFAKNGRLRKIKNGQFYSVQKNETPDVAASGVSGDEGGASSSVERGA